MTQGPVRGDVDARIQVAKQVEGFEKGCGMARPRCARARRNPASHPTVPLAPAVGVSRETSRVSQESHGKTVGRRDGRMRQSPGLRGMDSCKSPRHGFEAKPSAKTEPSGRRHVQDVAGPEGQTWRARQRPSYPCARRVSRHPGQRSGDLPDYLAQTASAAGFRGLAPGSGWRSGRGSSCV